jgi:hypothetical protein
VSGTVKTTALQLSLFSGTSNTKGTNFLVEIYCYWMLIALMFCFFFGCICSSDIALDCLLSNILMNCSVLHTELVEVDFGCCSKS